MDELRAALEQAKTGDIRGFAILVERFQDMAVGYAYSILGDFHLAEDAAQEAFIEAYPNLHKVYGPEAFPGWFRKILFKHCDRMLRRKRLSTVRLDMVTSLASRIGDPAAVTEARELEAETRKAVNSLPPTARSAITLFYISDYSQHEICEFLGIPITTLKSRLHRARRQLHERMIGMVEENLRRNRPSNDTAFSATVTTILQAAKTGDDEAVKVLLAKDPSLLHEHNDAERGHGRVTLLHYAAAAGSLSLAELLIDMGSDLNARDDSHKLTPLGWATVFPEESLEMADFLIQRGAKLDIWTATALGKWEVVEHTLAARPELVRSRLSKSDLRMQPLHLAAWKGHEGVVQVLLAHGADARSTDDLGTPSQRAEQFGNMAIAQLLGRHLIS